MNKFELFLENSLYTNDSEKQLLLKDNEKVLDAALINFFGFLSLFTLRNTGAFKQYDSTEGKLQVDAISDNNHDVSLAIKLAYDSGLLPKMNVDKMTRLLSLIKQKKIVSGKELSEPLIRDLYGDIKFTNIKPSILVSGVLNSFKSGGLGLSDLASEFYQIAKKKEYKDITLEFRQLVLKGQYTELFKKKSVNNTSTSNVVVPKQITTKLKQQDNDFVTLLFHTKTKDEFNKVLFDYNTSGPDIGLLNQWINDLLKSFKLEDIINSYLLEYIKLESKDTSSRFTSALDYYIYEIYSKIYNTIENIISNKDLKLFFKLFSDTNISNFIYSTKVPTADFAKKFRLQVKKIFADVYLPYLDSKGSLEMSGAYKLQDEYKLYIDTFTRLTFYSSIKDVESELYFDTFSYLIDKPLSYALIYWLFLVDQDYKTTVLSRNCPNGSLKDLIELSFGQNSIVDRTLIFDIILKKTAFDKATTEQQTLFNTMMQICKIGEIFDNTNTDDMYQLELRNIFEKYFSFTNNRIIDSLYDISSFSLDEFRTQFVKYTQKYSKPKFLEDITSVILDSNFSYISDTKTLDLLYICIEECLKKGMFKSKTFKYLISRISSYPKIEQRFSDLLMKYIKIIGLSEVYDDIPHIIYSCNNIDILKAIFDQLTKEKFVIDNIDVLKTLVERGKIYYLPSNKDIASKLFDKLLSFDINLSTRKIDEVESKFVYQYKKWLLTQFPSIKLEIIDKYENNSGTFYWNNYPISFLADSEITTKILDHVKLDLIEYTFTNVLFDNMKQISPKIYKILTEYRETVLNSDLIDLANSNSFVQFLALEDNLNEYLIDKNITYLIKKIENSNDFYRQLGNISEKLKTNYTKYTDKNLIKVIRVLFRGVSDIKNSIIFDDIVEIISTIYNSGNIDLAQKLFENLPPSTSYDDTPSEVAKSLFQTVQLSGILETMFSDNSLIKPYEKPDNSRIKDVLKFNNIKLKGKTFKGIQEFSELNKAILNVKKNPIDLQPLAVKEIPHTDLTLVHKTVDFNQYASAAKHGDIAVNVLREFDVSLPEQQAGIKAFMEAHKDSETKNPVFHGTGSIAASMILRYGFVILPKKATGTTYRMLGDGIYFTTVLDKASQYTNDNGYIPGVSGRLNGTKGYIFQMEAAMGYNNIDYISANTSSVVSPEWCVLDEKKQLRIYKCYEVEIINKEQLAQLKLQYGLNENIMQNFKTYLTEAVKPQYKYNSTYCFVDSMIPVSLDKTVSINQFIPSKFGKHVRKERSQFGWQVVIQHNNAKIADEIYRIKYADELMSNQVDLQKYLNLLNQVI